MTNGIIINELEHFAPPYLQEDWDNTGLQIGTRKSECTGVLLCVDVTPAVVQEAIDLGYNLIISHHPLFFKGVKRLVGADPVQVAAMNAIAAGISIYSCHTAVDSCNGGVSYEMARRLGVTPIDVLSPLRDRLIALDVYVPASHVDSLKMALCDIGAGAIGQYDCCSFAVNGTGSFRPLPGSSPFIGTQDHIEHVDETLLRFVMLRHLMGKAEQTIHEVHPYETPAYTFTPTLNTLAGTGLGIYGVLEQPIKAIDMVKRIKTAFGSDAVRTTLRTDQYDNTISRVAMCGGAGGEFIPRAIAAGAQLYLTSDVRYHDFVNYRNDIIIVDIGHYESEECTKQLFYQVITEKFPNFAVKLSTIENNSINYI